MKVLFITHKPSFPQIDGGCVASAQILMGLEKSELDYRVATLYTPKHPYSKQTFPPEIQAQIVLAHEIHSTDLLRNLKLWLSKKHSIFLGRFYDKSFANELALLCREFQPNIIHFESLFAAVYLQELRLISNAKFVLRSHNIEHQLWEDRLSQGGVMKKTLLNYAVKRLKIEEIEIYKQVHGIAAMAQSEVDFAASHHIKTPIIHLPTGSQEQTTKSTLGNDFFHLAAMDWEPNIKGLQWLLSKVWTTQNFQDKNVLHIAGKNLNSDEHSNVAGIINHGMVADSKAFMCDYGIMLVPLFEGSGLRIKIIEAGSLGVPIIATGKAVEGIGLENGKHYLEANDAEEFGQAMRLLMNDVSLRRNLGSEIHTFMRNHYDQVQLNGQLLEFYRNI